MCSHNLTGAAHSGRNANLAAGDAGNCLLVVSRAHRRAITTQAMPIAGDGERPFHSGGQAVVGVVAPTPRLERPEESKPAHC